MIPGLLGLLRALGGHVWEFGDVLTPRWRSRTESTLTSEDPTQDLRRDSLFNLSPYWDLLYLIRVTPELAGELLDGLLQKPRSRRQMGLRSGINPASYLELALNFGAGAGFLDAPPRYAPMVDAISGSGSVAAPGCGIPCWFFPWRTRRGMIRAL